jgi:hypothetical protein
MSQPNPNRLVVEDTDIHGVVVGIMKHHIEWGAAPAEWPVFVAKKMGKDSVFRELPVEIKGSGTQRLGIVVDADDDLAGTWNRVAAFCKKMGVAVQKKCPKEGLIVKIGDQTFGAWIMPNNEFAGMVENFCHELVPAGSEDLWKFAEECAKEAKKKGAKFSDQYLPKAHIHTWLAWQATPGERMGAAITGAALGHESESAKAFVKWFCDLYGLNLKVKADVAAEA